MTNTLEQFTQFARGKELKTITGNRCVIYTRVSTKDQADNNMSLVTQKKLCEQYCEKQGFEIIGYFGGTYESAKNDERKEFNNMLTFIKRSKQPISQIIVYSIDRFSRSGANAIYIKEQLKKQGVAIQSVTQPADTSTSSGRLQQNIQFIFSDFDNELRRDKSVTGMKEALLRGEWTQHAPYGYDHVKQNGQKSIVVNDLGRKLKQVFEWRANHGLSLPEIQQRLKKQGVKMNIQRLSTMIRNPFYCGLLTHNLLDGKVVEGKQEKLVSRELFLKANAANTGNSGGYKVLVENENIPLKHFVKCEGCGGYLRGYQAYKNKKYYYKCGTIGCLCNRRSEKVHEVFMNKVDDYVVNVTAEQIPMIKKAMKEIYEKNHSEKRNIQTEMESQLKEIKKKIERLEERFVDEEITKELFHKFHKKLVEEKREIEANLNQPSKGPSNLEKAIEFAIHLASKLNTAWHSADYNQKQKLQNLIFPEGMTYNRKNDECRTLRANSAFVCISELMQTWEEAQKNNPDVASGLSCWVPRTRVELVIPP